MRILGCGLHFDGVDWLDKFLVHWLVESCFFFFWQSDWSSRHYWILIHFTTHDIILFSEPGLTQTFYLESWVEGLRKQEYPLANNGWGSHKPMYVCCAQKVMNIGYTRNDLYAKCYCVSHCNRPAKVSGFSQDPRHPQTQYTVAMESWCKMGE